MKQRGRLVREAGKPLSIRYSEVVKLREQVKAAQGNATVEADDDERQ
jgi:hypothetical protein